MTTENKPDTPGNAPDSGSAVERLIMLKRVTDIETANCSTCSYLGSDGDGPEYNGSWPICDKIDRMGYLKSFPFKKEMKCWEPNFWFSKFASMIKNGTDDEMQKAGDAFRSALEA